MHKPSNIVDIRESTFYNKNVNDNIKIACIGDIHISNLVGIDDIYKIINSLIEVDPDYICFVGDILDSPKELTNENSLNNAKLLMDLCSEIAPTLVVLGNHDFMYNGSKDVDDFYECMDEWEEICNIPNVNLLSDEVFSDDRIVVTGYRQKKDAYFSQNSKMKEDSMAFYNDFSSRQHLYRNLAKDKPKILLTHSPEVIGNEKVQELLSEYDIILTGHYHNGCVPSFLEKVYPGNFGIITPTKRPFPKIARGIKKLDNGSYLFLSGGWVKLSESAPKILQPLDIICNRQMDVINLTPDEKYINGCIQNKKLVLKK